MQRLRFARAYLEAADFILVDDRDEFCSVAVGNAILAAIAAADAMCCKGLGKVTRGEDHRQAAELLESSSVDGPRYKRLLLRRLDMKDAAHYGFEGFSKADAKKAVKLARELVTGADTVFQR